MKFIKNTSGGYHNVDHIRDLYVDNNSATDWYVAVRMIDSGAVFAVLSGFTTQAAAETAAQEVVDALGYINLGALL